MEVGTFLPKCFLSCGFIVLEQNNYHAHATHFPSEHFLLQEFVSVWVQKPQFHKDDFWHTHIDYEICLHTNSMCFRKKTSCVRRRYSEFVWLRQRLQDNTMLIELPKLPPWNPFFSLNNPCKVNQRMNGLQEFLEIVLQDHLLLSDSRVHLFLQSQLSMTKMEACVLGQTRYTVAQAIQMCSDCHRTRFPIEKGSKIVYEKMHDFTSAVVGETTQADMTSAILFCTFSLSSTMSSLGHSHDSGVPQSPSPLPFDCSTCENSDSNICIRDEGFFSSLSESSCDQEHMEP
uniref:Sorting nexin 10a n=1 Tax=Hucho hucho TaxID=62062 RepID=A0A4W5RM37_9TELE